MAINIEKMSVEALVDAITRGEVDVNLINLAKSAHREAFVQVLQKRPAILTKVKSVNANHIISYALKQDPNYFIYLNKEQYTNEFAQIYLASRFEKKKGDTTAEKKSYGISTQKSLDNSMLFLCSYATPEGDEIFYFDTEMQVPSSIKSSFKMTLKLTDAVALINELDVHVTNLGALKIKTMLSDTIASCYKSFFSNYLVKNKVGYYTLCASLAEVEEGFMRAVQKQLGDFGIEVTQVIIEKLAIPKDIQNKVEDLAFQLRQQRASVEADAEFAKTSLEYYEAKLAVQQKYPGVEPTLTEYEKDLALKRYLIKTGRMSEKTIDHSIKIARKSDQIDSVLSKKADVVPEIAPKKNVFRSRFILFGVLSTVASGILFAAGAGVGLIALGITVGAFGSIAAFNMHKFKDEKVEIEEDNANV